MQRGPVIRIIRRSLIRVLAALCLVAILISLCASYSVFVEPRWLKVRHVRLSDRPGLRVIHFSDLHFKGDTSYLKKVVATINGLHADIVCFTGDLIEDARYLDEALGQLAEVNKPMFGVAGNHDLWEIRSFGKVEQAFQHTGGHWLTNTAVFVSARNVQLFPRWDVTAGNPEAAGSRQILLIHYPKAVKSIRNRRFDAILAGHTHGGQVQLPFVTRRLIPYDIELDKGLFRTPAGPLHVNPGVGTYHYSVRFFCRPEITVIEL